MDESRLKEALSIYENILKSAKDDIKRSTDMFLSGFSNPSCNYRSKDINDFAAQILGKNILVAQYEGIIETYKVMLGIET